jgi:hypothetical protein
MEEGPSLPEGFVGLADKGEVRCGNLVVQVLDEPGAEGIRFVKVTGPTGAKVYEAHGRRYRLDATTQLTMDLSLEFCGDLTGDGVPELLLTERTMGAHCCYTHYAISMTSPSKRLLMWEKGDAGTPVVPVRYRPGAAWQLEGLVVFWPPFNAGKGDPVLSYASAPLLPVVFSLSGGQYQLASLSFPEAYLRHRTATWAACTGPGDCDGDLYAWLDSVAIGDWDNVKARVKDAEFRRVLDARTVATRKQLLRQVGSEKLPARTTAR